MEKKTLLKKIEEKSWLIILIFLVLTFFQTCSVNRKYNDLKKSIEKIDSTTKITSKQFSIEGFKISKRMLYDNNAIVRTAIRPDDRMNEYDIEIKKLEGK